MSFDSSTNGMNANIIKQFKLLILQKEHDIKNAKNPREKTVDMMKLRKFKDALTIISKYKKKIKHGTDLKEYPGIGQGIMDRIDEILTKGKLKEVKIKAKEQKESDIILEFTKVIGIGAKKAKEIYDLGIRTIDDLKTAVKKHKVSLNDTAKLGLRYYGIVNDKIPREEMDKHKKFLEKVLAKIDPKLIGIVGGSYRRGKPSSGDIDFLIFHPDVKTRQDLVNHSTNYLKTLITKLHKKNYIIEDIDWEGISNKYMGLSRLPSSENKYPVRRLDIRYMPYDSYYTAILHVTGSNMFNQKLRNLAKHRGFKLNEYGLYQIITDEETGKQKYRRMKITSEKAIFKKIDTEYVKPEDR